MTEGRTPSTCGRDDDRPHYPHRWGDPEVPTDDRWCPGTSVEVRPPEFWVATGPKRLNGRRKLGPFGDRDLALTVRDYIETAEKRDDLWVVEGQEIPDV